MYVTTVHAMKSALANTGETKLSDMALQLEQAGREQNLGIMNAKTPEYLERLREVIKKIKALEGDGETLTEDTDDALEYLREELQVIQAASLEYEKKTAKEALARLRQKTWSERTRKVLETIAGHLLHSDFEEAAVTAKDYLGITGKK